MRYLVPAFLLAILAAQPALANGALAIDENQGDQWGWAVDYPDFQSARDRALQECGDGCSIVADFETGCSAYAADSAEGSTVWSWSLAVNRSTARDIALSECRKRGGTQCVIRAWGCNSLPLAEPQFVGAEGEPPAGNAPDVAETPPATPVDGRTVFVHVEAMREISDEESSRTNFCGWTDATVEELERYRSQSAHVFWLDESAYSGNDDSMAALAAPGYESGDAANLGDTVRVDESPILQRFIAAIIAHPEYDGSMPYFVHKDGTRTTNDFPYTTDGAWSVEDLTGYWCDFMVERNNVHYWTEHPQTAVVIGRF